MTQLLLSAWLGIKIGTMLGFLVSSSAAVIACFCLAIRFVLRARVDTAGIKQWPFRRG